MSEFKDQREAYNTGMHDALNMTKHWINKFKLNTIDQVYVAMGEVLANHQYRQIEKQLRDAVRTKDYNAGLTKDGEQDNEQLVKTRREKEMAVTRAVIDAATEDTQAAP